jgi:hypothetical protein
MRAWRCTKFTSRRSPLSSSAPGASSPPVPLRKSGQSSGGQGGAGVLFPLMNWSDLDYLRLRIKFISGGQSHTG